MALILKGLRSEVVTVDLNTANEIVIPGSGNANRDNEVERAEPTDDDDSSDDSEDVNENNNLTSSMVSGRDNDEDNLPPNIEPALVSGGVASQLESPTGFNDFDDAETPVNELDILSNSSARTYSYSFNLDEIDLVNQLSVDQNIRRATQAIQFDVNVLASAFLDELDSSKQHFISDRLAIGTPEVAVSAASLLTVGYFVWNMGSGILLSTFMSSLPTWAAFDVLPVISSSANDDEDDESIEQMVDA